MNKHFLIVCNLILSLLLLGLLYACQDSLLDVSQPSLEERQQAIASAKELYEKQIPEEMQTRTVVSAPSIRLKPEWKYSTVQKNLGYMAVEVAIKTEYNYSFMTPEAKELFVKQKDTRYRQSQTRLVFLTSQETNETDIFLMTIVPDVSYLEQTQFKPFRKVSYLKRDNNFSGFIFYQDINGNFVNGWKYANGKVTHDMKIANGEKPEGNLLLTRSGSGCTNYYLEWEVEVCGSWVVNGEYEGSDCYTYMEYTYWYTSCPNGGGSGGYEGGGSNGSTGNSVAVRISSGDEVRYELDRVVDEKLLQCAFKYINSMGIKFSDVVVNPSLKDPGAFYASTGVYAVQSINSISVSFAEEYIHAFQHQIYGGIEKYSGVGRANIEFEAKLIQDLSCIYSGYACPKYGKGVNYHVQYENWINEITNYGMKNVTFDEIFHTSYNGLTYWDFLEDYVSPIPDYNTGIDMNLAPRVLNELINHFNC